MGDLRQLFAALTKHEHILDNVMFKQFTLFVDLISHMRLLIQLRAEIRHLSTPPLQLDEQICDFVSHSLSSVGPFLSTGMISHMWSAFSRVIWSLGERRDSNESLLPFFLEYGTPCGIGYITIAPPVLTCTGPNKICRHKHLTEPRSYPATLFTLAHGPIPVFPISLYCRTCRTRYYSNYFVHDNALVRTYYASAIPAYIQTSNKFFIEARVCELFANMMMFAWVSATNCSRIYNTALGDKDGLRELGLQWKNVMKMDMENVWEAFHIHSLLIDQISLGEFHSQNQPLSLPHKDATQRLDRFVGALQARNIRFSDYHRPHYNHVCDGCSKVVERDGTMSLIRSAVTDGVTLGRPCCAVHDCKGSLSSPKRRYCPDHQELEGICATIGCDNPIRPGFKTCNRPECIQVEELYKEEGLAMKKFKERLERQKGHISVVHDPLLTAALGFTTDGQVDSVQPDDEVEVEIMSGSHPEDGMDIDKSGKEPQARATCTGKSDGHQKRLKARFGRKRTFCEELVVLSCGIVIGRTTFYGSEAPNGVVTFWEHLFPTPQSVPTFMWYDNNCHVKKILRNEPEHRLNQVALPVDVFHFKTKHKDNDKFCGEHCNPILWPELRDGDKWTFNSSAAEQVNAWIGGFLAMVREMREENCAFFLDEMLRRRNEYRIGELDRKGMQPKHINMDILMEGWDGYSPL